MYTNKKHIIVLYIALIVLIITLAFTSYISYTFENKIHELDKQITYLESTIENRKSSIKPVNEPLSYRDEHYIVQREVYIQEPKKENPDLRILAQLIESESGSQSFEGKLAVGTVVMNRVESDEFPNTIRGVIFQKNQFSVVNDGSIYNEPSEDSIKAAKMILDGTRTLSSNVLYFYNPKIVKASNWIRSRKTMAVIGDHRFAF